MTGGYLQDQWQATQDLTLNIGVRYDAEFNTLLNDFTVPWINDADLVSKIDPKYLNRWGAARRRRAGIDKPKKVSK